MAHVLPLRTFGLMALAMCLTAACGSQPGGEPARQEGGKSTSPAEEAPPKVPSLAPLDGPSLLAHIRKSGRKGTLVNAWASWCGPCKRELPMLVELRSALEADGIELMLVSVDAPGQRRAAAELLAALPGAPAGYTVRGSIDAFKRAVHPAWKGAIPSTFLFDASGALKYFWPGPVYEHEVSTIVSAFLAGQPLEGPTLVEPGPPPG